MKRIILSTFISVALVIFVPFISCQACTGLNNTEATEISSANIPDKKGMTVKGLVLTTQNEPVEGVVVTDGTHFTVTNKRGIYYLPADLARNKFVSISTPSAYEIASDNGIASGFYAKLTYGKEVNQHNFILKKRVAVLNEFTYIAISDPQVKNTIQLDRFQKETVPDLKNYIAQHSGKEIYGVALGDLVWDAMGLFPAYKTSVSSLGLTMFHTIGNHDFDLTYNDLHNTENPLDNYAEENYESFFGPTDYSFNVGNVHVITLKSIDYFKKKKYTEQFTDDQLEWLKKDLSYVKSGSLVFLNLHAPTSNRSDSSAANIRNASELMKILKDYRVHIFAGHTHFYENEEVTSTIYEHNIGAACGAWWAGYVNRCGAPNGYLIVDVKNNDVKWHYKATGHDINYQFRIYKPGEFKSQVGFVVVNVWDWDSKYKVKWYEDEKLKGTMEQFSDEDQDYITMTGKPKGYQTRHLFRATPSSVAKNIKIEVTNRFGEVYTENISLE